MPPQNVVPVSSNASVIPDCGELARMEPYGCGADKSLRRHGTKLSNETNRHCTFNALKLSWHIQTSSRPGVNLRLFSRDSWPLTGRLESRIGACPESEVSSAFHLWPFKVGATLDRPASQRNQEPGIPRRGVRRKLRPGELHLCDLQGKFPR